jgi:hypothetical protein
MLFWSRPLSARLISVCALALLALTAGRGRAQSDSGNDLSLTVNNSAMRRYEPNTWSALGIEGVNRSDEGQDGMMSIYFDEDTDRQYARRMWVPGRSIRRSWLPVFISANLPAGQTSVQISSMQLEQSDSGEVVRRTNNEQIIKEDIAVVDREVVKTATIYAGQDLVSGRMHSRANEAAYELIVKSRMISSLSRITLDFEADFIPPSHFMLESVDQIVLAGDRLIYDTAGLLAVRNWLMNGGRMWIMADRVRPETVERILGNAACYEIVDHVEMTDFTLNDRTSANDAESWSAEVPTEMVRVVTDAAEIHCEIDGWPAAFWQPFGDGEVLFTTLSPAGWLRPKVPGVESRPMGALGTISSRLYLPRQPIELEVAAMRPILEERIGYRIPSRGFATMLLATNCIGLLIVGTFLARRQQLEHMAWLVPAICGTVAVMLLSAGMTNSRSVPPTLAAMELVRANPDFSQAHATGVGAVYSQDAIDLSFESDATGLVEPEFSEASVETNRLEWNDNGQPKWVNLSTSPGSIRMVRYEQMRQLDESLAVVGRLGPRGLEGRVVGTEQEGLSDLLIAAPPSPNLAIRLQRDGSFVAGNGEILARDQYLTDTLLTDEQRRRQIIYRDLLDPSDEVIYPRTSTLLGWRITEGPDLGLPSIFEQRAASLITIPLRLDRTPPETRFLVPAAFVRIESFIGSYGASTVFNPRSGLWTEDVMRPTNTQLRFRLPGQVLPCQLERAEMTIRINAPSRTVEITRPTFGEPRVLRSLTNPSGVVRLTFDDPDILELDQHGGLLFGFRVSQTARQLAPPEEAPVDTTPIPTDRDDPRNRPAVDNSTWQIDYVRLNVTGATLPR